MAIEACLDLCLAKPFNSVFFHTSSSLCDMADRQDHNAKGGGMDPELALNDRVDLTHADEKEAQKFAPREDNYDATAEHGKGSSGEKVIAHINSEMFGTEYCMLHILA